MMRYPLCAVLAVGSLLLCVLSGCEDPQAKQEREAQDALAAVVAQHLEAAQGYPATPAGGATSQPAERGGDRSLEALAREARRADNLGAARQAQLAKVAEELEKLKAAGTPAQQAMVHRLLSDVYASQSRHLARQAQANWAAISGREGKLVADVLALNRAEARAKRFTGDESASLTTFKSYQETLAGKVKAAEEEAGQLRAAVQQSTAQVKELTEQREAAQGEAGKYRADALGKSGEEQYKLYEKATEAQRRADAADAKADQAAAQLSVQQSQLAVVEKQIALAKEAIAKMEKEAGVVTAAQQTRETLQKKALSGDRNNEPAGAGSVTEELLADFAAFDGDYRKNVEQVFDAAVTAAEKAAGAAAKSDVPLDLVSAQLTLVDVRTQQAQRAAAYGRTLSVVLGLAGETAKAKLEVCRQALKQVRDKQSGATQAALEVAKQVEESQAKADLKDIKDEDLRKTFEGLIGQYKERLGELAKAGPAK